MRWLSIAGVLLGCASESGGGGSSHYTKKWQAGLPEQKHTFDASTHITATVQASLTLTRSSRSGTTYLFRAELGARGTGASIRARTAREGEAPRQDWIVNSTGTEGTVVSLPGVFTCLSGPCQETARYTVELEALEVPNGTVDLVWDALVEVTFLFQSGDEVPPFEAEGEMLALELVTP